MKAMRESRDGKANGEAEVHVLLAVGSREAQSLERTSVGRAWT